MYIFFRILSILITSLVFGFIILKILSFLKILIAPTFIISIAIISGVIFMAIKIKPKNNETPQIQCSPKDCSSLNCGDDNGCGTKCETGKCNKPNHTCVKGECTCSPKDCFTCNITLFNFNKYPEYTGYWRLNGISYQVRIEAVDKNNLSLVLKDADDYKIMDVILPDSEDEKIKYKFYYTTTKTDESTFTFDSIRNRYISDTQEFFWLTPLICCDCSKLPCGYTDNCGTLCKNNCLCLLPYSIPQITLWYFKADSGSPDELYTYIVKDSETYPDGIFLTRTSSQKFSPYIGRCVFTNPKDPFSSFIMENLNVNFDFDRNINRYIGYKNDIKFEIYSTDYENFKIDL